MARRPAGSIPNPLPPNLSIRYEERLPDPLGYNELRKAVAWPEIDVETARIALPCSLYGVCAFAGARLVGTGRVVGDGGLCFYLQDLIVLPDYQGLRIGVGIMDRLDGLHRKPRRSEFGSGPDGSGDKRGLLPSLRFRRPANGVTRTRHDPILDLVSLRSGADAGTYAHGWDEIYTLLGLVLDARS